MPKTMRAAAGREFMKSLNIEEVPIPTPGSGGRFRGPIKSAVSRWSGRALPIQEDMKMIRRDFLKAGAVIVSGVFAASQAVLSYAASA